VYPVNTTRVLHRTLFSIKLKSQQARKRCLFPPITHSSYETIYHYSTSNFLSLTQHVSNTTSLTPHSPAVPHLSILPRETVCRCPLFDSDRQLLVVCATHICVHIYMYSLPLLVCSSCLTGTSFRYCLMLLFHSLCPRSNYVHSYPHTVSLSPLLLRPSPSDLIYSPLPILTNTPLTHSHVRLAFQEHITVITTCHPDTTLTLSVLSTSESRSPSPTHLSTYHFQLLLPVTRTIATLRLLCVSITTSISM
jgi:hypothetical protein